MPALKEETHNAAGFSYRLIRLKRKSVTLEIRDGELIVKAPKTTPVSAIDSFITKKRVWIESKKQAFHRKRERFQDVFKFRAFLLNGLFILAVPADIKKIQLKEDRFLLPQELTGDKLLSAAKKWYRRYALAELNVKLKAASEKLGLPFNLFSLTNAKGKWGSCDSKNNIRLNWRLVFLPENLQNYVIIHELCHTEYHNHSKNYWTFVSKFIPDYKSARKQLKEYSVLIQLYR